MKTKSFTFVTAGIAAALSAPAFALETPADDAPPPPGVNMPAAEKDTPPSKPLRFGPQAAEDNRPQAEATAFLGVVTSDLPEMLADHLGLKVGDGILVRSLMPDGPAAKAGIATHDIITKLAGQPVRSPIDLSKQVAAHKPGDTVNVELIHKGKPAKIDVTLGTRPEGVAAAEDPQPLNGLNLDGLPQDLAERVRKAIEGNLGGLDLHFGEEAGQVPPAMEDAMRELKERMRGGFLDNDAPQGKIEMRSGATVRMKDPQGSVEVKTKDGSKEVIIRDSDDKITWNGPWDTEQDKAAAPEEVRKRVESLNIDPDFKGNGLRLRPRPMPLDEE
jgi:serine protease Do